MLFSENEEKRKAFRTRINNSVELQVVGLDELRGSLSQDISSTGLRIIVSRFIPVNSELKLNVELAPNDYADCLGRVMWIRHIPHSDNYELGIKFEWFDPTYQAKNRIAQYAEQNS